MKIFTPISVKIFISLVLIVAHSKSTLGQTTLDFGTISVMEDSGGGFPGGTSTFNLSAADIPNVSLFTNFNIVDAGVDISVNGTSLFPQFDDVSQFGPTVVFLDTGVTAGTGNIDLPFSPNSNGLPRLTVNSSSAGTIFGGAATPGATSTIPYTPNFAVQDFTSLLISGQNEIVFSVLNSFQGANLQGDFTVSLNSSTAVPEPGVTGFAILALMTGLLRRSRKLSA